MSVPTLESIKKRVVECALKIHAPSNLLPFFGPTKYDGVHYIEVDNHFMYYKFSERGCEFENKFTDNLDELLYWIFENVTRSMASIYAIDNKVVNIDKRRILFKYQEDLLGILDSRWQLKKILDHELILKEYPFDDLKELRLIYRSELRKKGLSNIEIDKLALAKYPILKNE